MKIKGMSTDINGFSKSTVHVIKHAYFQFYRVHPYIVNLTIDNKFIKKQVRLCIHQCVSKPC